MSEKSEIQIVPGYQLPSKPQAKGRAKGSYTSPLTIILSQLKVGDGCFIPFSVISKKKVKTPHDGGIRQITLRTRANMLGIKIKTVKDMEGEGIHVSRVEGQPGKKKVAEQPAPVEPAPAETNDAN